MKTIGIITIHRINNYGSVLQTFALQQKLIDLNCKTFVIDYLFPNDFHKENGRKSSSAKRKSFFSMSFLWKICYGRELYLQHKKIKQFISNYLKLSQITYNSPDELKRDPPIYDVYMTGSDQVWNPRYCNGDPTFFLDFIPENKIRVAYSASFGVSDIDSSYYADYAFFLKRYKLISVREKSGQYLIEKLINRKVSVVLDPTLLLTATEWESIATKKRIVSRKYILCYYLNYSFDAHPYADELALYVQQITGYEIVYVARPPVDKHYKSFYYKVDASPQDFIALVRDAELVLTTSFHGTAFAVNYSKPLFSVVEDKLALDSRQADLLKSIGLESRILSIKDCFPTTSELPCDYEEANKKLSELREYSLKYLSKAVLDE